MKYTDLANTIQNKKNDFENIASEDEAIAYILKEYKILCNSMDYDYEFHYVDDIKNDSGAMFELVNFFKKYAELRFVGNTDFMDCNEHNIGCNDDIPFQVEVVLYNPITTDDESCVYQYMFKTTKQALSFADKIDKVMTYDYKVVETLYTTLRAEEN